MFTMKEAFVLIWKSWLYINSEQYSYWSGCQSGGNFPVSLDQHKSS